MVKRWLIVRLPEHWVVVPEGVAALQQYLWGEFRAELKVLRIDEAGSSLQVTHHGAWGHPPPLVTVDLQQRIEAAVVWVGWAEDGS